MGGVNFETSACSGVARVGDTRCGTKNLLTFFALSLATQSFSDHLVLDARN